MFWMNKTQPPLGQLTAAEFRCYREQLGFTRAQLAIHFDIAERRVARWEDGSEAISQWAAEAMLKLYNDAADVVDSLVTDLQQGRASGPLQTYRSDSVYADEGGTMPASWHRAVMVRVAEETGDRIVYHPKDTLERKLAPWELDNEV